MRQVFWDHPASSAQTSLQARCIRDLTLEIQTRKPGWVQDIFAPETDLEPLKRWTQSWSNSSGNPLKTIVVLGTGGSSLGGRTLNQALNPGSTGMTPEAPQLLFLDNVDSRFFQRALHKLQPAETGVVAISKSGHTLETLFQLLTCWEHWASCLSPHERASHFAVLTEHKPSPLRHYAETHGFAIWDHPCATGGRFAVWSSVGALPSYAARLPFEEFRAGARATLEAFITCPETHPVVQGCLWHDAYRRPQHVMIPYHDDLVAWSLWHRQLWAESLGKNGQGSTPICALGTVDQHSQLQLYLDGPADKSYTFVIFPEPTVHDTPLRTVCDLGPDLTYLEGRTMHHLWYAEQQATRQTLQDKKHPVREWILPCWDAATMGSLMVHCVLEVILTASFWDVDPYDQPAVESIKQKTRDLLMAPASS